MFDSIGIQKSFNHLDVEFDQEMNQLNIHFGNIKNELIPEFHKRIEQFIHDKKVNGRVTIFTTQGIETSLLSVLIYIIDDEQILEIEYM